MIILVGAATPTFSIRLESENDEKKFYRLLQIISNLPITIAPGSDHEIVFRHSRFFHDLCEAIELSDVNISLVVEDDEIIFYPKGEEKLDDVLSEEVSSFLNPESQKHFVDALHAFSNLSPNNAIKSTEGLRRSLEEFMPFKFENEQGLAGNIQELAKKLKEDSRDPRIRNIVVQNFNLLDHYFYENSKHSDGDIDEAENEFLMYQTGPLMRYIEKNT